MNMPITILSSAAIEFYVPGKPQTAGSKRGFVNPRTGKVIITEAGSKRSKASWRTDLRDAAAAALGDRPMFGPYVPVEVTFIEARKRPAAHVAKDGSVRERFRSQRPCVRPDMLKVARAAEDALTGILWADDAQIVSERLGKWYADQLGFDTWTEGLVVRASPAGAEVAWSGDQQGLGARQASLL